MSATNDPVGDLGFDPATAGVAATIIAVAATDNSDQLARFIKAPYVSLGTDGYGPSDSREDLRRHFAIDVDGICRAALRIAS